MLSSRVNTAATCDSTPSDRLETASSSRYVLRARSRPTTISSAISAKNTGVASVMIRSCTVSGVR